MFFLRKLLISNRSITVFYQLPTMMTLTMMRLDNPLARSWLLVVYAVRWPRISLRPNATDLAKRTAAFK